MSYDETSRKNDMIERGRKEVNYAGNLTFLGTRALDPFLQYGILAKGWGAPLVQTLRGSTLPQGPPWITNSVFDRLGLSPYRSILMAMSVGSMLKQNYWLGVIMQEKMSVGSGAMVGAFNAVANSINTLLFVCAQTSTSTNGEHFPQSPLIVGSSLYVAGILIELISEQQRHNWKKRSANKGKVYEGGLFSLSRHINYFGYTLWRTGYALASGGWAWGAIVGSFFTYNFMRQTIPYHQHYMESKYGEQFEHYKQAVPYRFAPYLF